MIMKDLLHRTKTYKQQILKICLSELVKGIWIGSLFVLYKCKLVPEKSMQRGFPHPGLTQMRRQIQRSKEKFRNISNQRKIQQRGNKIEAAGSGMSSRLSHSRNESREDFGDLGRSTARTVSRRERPVVMSARKRLKQLNCNTS